MAFVLREARRDLEQSHFDAEDVIGLSSPYKGTAERSSAAKKPHQVITTGRAGGLHEPPWGMSQAEP